MMEKFNLKVITNEKEIILYNIIVSGDYFELKKKLSDFSYVVSLGIESKYYFESYDLVPVFNRDEMFERFKKNIDRNFKNKKTNNTIIRPRYDDVYLEGVDQLDNM
jgi:hypothetical protein